MAPAEDRISNLPKSITEAILKLLPLRDAVRTSILSRNWRYEWNTLPHLVFDDDLFTSLDDEAQNSRKLVKIVNQVFLHHHGPVHKFKLLISSRRRRDIDTWILFLSRNGIKEFTFKTSDWTYKVPSCLYLCEELTYLELHICKITLPALFIGFCSLTTLDLHYVNFLGNQLEILISACPLLKKLVLEYISGCGHLKIFALKLEVLQVHHSCEDISFENTPLLALVSMALLYRKGQAISDGGVCKLVQIFHRLPRIETLEILWPTLKDLSRGDVPLRLPTTCQLKYLEIDIDFGDVQQMSGAFCLFRSSPILRELRIKACTVFADSALIAVFWEAEKNFGCFFSGLQILEVTGLTRTTSELKFLEYVLTNAPILVTVRIRLRQFADEVNIFRELLGFTRLSPKAKIVFL